MTEIFWIGHPQQRQLAIVARPLGGDWLADELASVKAAGIDVLVSFLNPDEAAELGLEDERVVAEEQGLEFISFPIPDREVPRNLASFRELVRRLADDVRRGKRVGAHCRGCIGRSTVLIASVMIALGADPERALWQIERARGFAVPDTPEQLEWLLNFRPEG